MRRKSANRWTGRFFHRKTLLPLREAELHLVVSRIPTSAHAIQRLGFIHRWFSFLSMSVDRLDASHSLNFDQRRRPETLRTAMATAFF
jgi:hypothetical protein